MTTNETKRRYRREARKRERTSIGLLRSTKEMLDQIKHQGQSYDGLLQELVSLWKKIEGEVSQLKARGRQKVD